MTLVRTLQTLPNPDGTRRPAEGFFIWTPTERRIIEGNPDEVVQPAGFAVELDLSGGFEVDVAATGTNWVWRVDERLKGLRAKTSYVVVPAEGPVDFTDLVPVNIASLRETAVPDHIWYVYTDHLAMQAQLAKEAAQASEDSALNSQDSAAVSASLADDSADAAGVSAFNAAASAATALGHKNAAQSSEEDAFAYRGYAEAAALAAQGSEDAAGISLAAAIVARQGSEAARDISVQSRTGAEAARDDAELALSIVEGIELNQVETGLVDSSGHLILTKRDDSTVDAGKVILPTTLTVGTVDTGPDLIGNIGPMGPQGPKGDPGGWVTSVIPTGTNLDLVVTPGLYLNPNTNSANGPSNTVGYGGHLEVIFSSNWLIQRYTSIFETRKTYIRYRNSSGTWGPWYTYTTNRVDQSAGRAIYQWDAINNRDQLIYGDTGQRVIPLQDGWTAPWARLRRHNAICTLTFVNLDGTLATNDNFYTLPVGFRPNTGGYHASLPFMNTTNQVSILRITGGGNLFFPLRAAAYSANLQASVSWVTEDPWPTSLPGTTGTNPINT